MHTPVQVNYIEINSFKCRTCGESFENKWHLMNHRRDIHPTKRICIYDLEDRCNFQPKQCWYRHKIEGSGENISTTLKCYTCEIHFENRMSLMKHRKIQHPNNCKPCKKYSEGTCPRNDETCWYKHINQDFLEDMMEQNTP